MSLLRWSEVDYYTEGWECKFSRGISFLVIKNPEPVTEIADKYLAFFRIKGRTVPVGEGYTTAKNAKDGVRHFIQGMLESLKGCA